MNDLIGRKKWDKLKFIKLPPDIMRLIRLSAQFEDTIVKIEKLSPYIDSVLFRDSFIIFLRIINLYIDLLSDVIGNDSKARNEVLKDIYSYMKFMFDKNGNFDFSGKLISIKNEQDAEFVRTNFFMPALAFIESRIYDPLVFAIKNNNIMSQFLAKSFKRRGAGMLTIKETMIPDKLSLGGDIDEI